MSLPPPQVCGREWQLVLCPGERSDANGDLYRVVVGDVGDAIIAVEGAEAEDLDVADEEVVYHRAFVLAEGVVGYGVAGAVGQGAGVLQAYGVEAAEDGIVDGGVHVATHNCRRPAGPPQGLRGSRRRGRVSECPRWALLLRNHTPHKPEAPRGTSGFQ